MTALSPPALLADVPTPSLMAVFAPVRSQTAFEETVERLGVAIRLGLLAPGTRLPPERDLCEKLGIARSTLRQALVALGQSGHLHAIRGRGGGTFVADPQPPAPPPSERILADWQDICDRRTALETGVALLAVERADAATVAHLEELTHALEAAVERFGIYRQLDVRFHVGLAEATRSPRLITDMTRVQGEMTGLISLVAHPPEVLNAANQGHRRVLDAIRAGDGARAAWETAEHVRGTRHVLAGLLPTFLTLRRPRP